MNAVDIVIGIIPPTLRQPMLAPTRIPFPEEIGWPVLASRKIDGVRGLLFPAHGLRSRSGCSWRNVDLVARMENVQAIADGAGIVLDGELTLPGLRPEELEAVLRDPRGDLAGLAYSVFDAITLREFNGESVTPFGRRQHIARKVLNTVAGVTVLEQRLLRNWEELLPFYRQVRSAGGEGLMIRRPDGLYRHGRCTMLERAIWKVRPLHPNSRQAEVPCGLEV